MKIIVCIKQVPDTNEVKIDPVKGTLIRDGVPSIINPDDKHALEEAVCLKEKVGGEVKVICMGPPQAKIALREALAMGADEAILLTDRAFAGADTYATSYALSCAINALGGADVIFCGQQAIDGDTAQVGPSTAERLNIPQITGICKLEATANGEFIATRETEYGVEKIATKAPVLFTAVKTLNTPRYPSVRGIVDAFNADIKELTAKDVDAKEENCGLNASPTHVVKTFTPQPKGKGKILEGTPDNAIKALLGELAEKNIWKVG